MLLTVSLLQMTSWRSRDRAWEKETASQFALDSISKDCIRWDQELVDRRSGTRYVLGGLDTNNN